MSLEILRHAIANPKDTNFDIISHMRNVEGDARLLNSLNLEVIHGLQTLNIENLTLSYDAIMKVTKSLLESESCSESLILYHYAVTRILLTKFKPNINRRKKTPFHIDFYFSNLEEFADKSDQSEAILMSVLDLFQFDLIQFAVPYQSVAAILIKSCHNNLSGQYKTCIPTILSTSEINITHFAQSLNELATLEDDHVYFTTMQILIDLQDESTTLYKNMAHMLSLVNSDQLYHQLPVIQPLFNSPSPHIRMAMITASTQFMLSNAVSEHPHDSSEMLSLVMDRFLDQHGQCRSKAVQSVGELMANKAIPPQMHSQVTQDIMSRTKDTSHFCRKSALKSLIPCINNHPFYKDGGHLSDSECNGKLDLINTLMTSLEENALTPEHQSQITNLLEQFQSSIGDVSSATQLQQSLTVIQKYYMEYADFINIFTENIPHISSCLLSKQKTLVQQCITLVYELTIYQHDLGITLLKQVMQCIWRKEASTGHVELKTMKANIINMFNTYFFGVDEHVATKRLIAFYHCCNDVDLLGIREILKDVDNTETEANIEAVVLKLVNIINSDVVTKEQKRAATGVLECLNVNITDIKTLYSNYPSAAILELLDPSDVKWAFTVIHQMDYASLRCICLKLNQIEDMEELLNLIYQQYANTKQVEDLIRLLVASAFCATQSGDVLNSVLSQSLAATPAQANSNIVASMEDVFTNYMENLREQEMWSHECFYKGMGDFVSFSVRNLHKIKNKQLQLAFYQCLGQFMVTSQGYLQVHLDYFIELLKLEHLTRTGIVVIGDLMITHSHSLYSHVHFIFPFLESDNVNVVITTVLVMTRLILQGLIKSKGVLGNLSHLLIHKDSNVALMIQGFFIELSEKDDSIYNNIVDIVSHLHSAKCDMDGFIEILQFLYSFLSSHQTESVLERFLVRFENEYDDYLLTSLDLLSQSLNDQSTSTTEEATNNPTLNSSCSKYLSKWIGCFKYYKEALRNKKVNEIFVKCCKRLEKYLKVEEKMSLNELVKEMEACLINSSPKLDKRMKKLSLKPLEAMAGSEDEILTDIAEE
eukprot:NODE_25_length_41203_cov_0.917113.p4 type:complete len:1048 gc:universal NODE_25_length_41203_cov_0.917113:12121-15264(+)